MKQTITMMVTGALAALLSTTTHAGVASGEALSADRTYAAKPIAAKTGVAPTKQSLATGKSAKKSVAAKREPVRVADAHVPPTSAEMRAAAAAAPAPAQLAMAGATSVAVAAPSSASPAPTNPYLAYNWKPSNGASKPATAGLPALSLSSLLPNNGRNFSLIPTIKTVYPTGEKPLVVVSFKCPTELIGIVPPPVAIIHEVVNAGLDGVNKSNLLSFNMQQVCE
jgi:hypothetical protein